MNNNAVGLLEVVATRAFADSDETLFSWSVPFSRTDIFADICDEWWSATGGSLQSYFRTTTVPCYVTIDFSCVEWIDPIPLLGLFVALKNFCLRTESTVIVELGNELSQNQRRSGFIGFVSQHGFLASLGDLHNCFVKLGGKTYPLDHDSPIWVRFASEELVLTYPESRCLTARIVSIEGLRDDTDRAISLELKKWLDEFRDYGLKPYFEGEAELIDDVLHKVRVLLTEILHNAIEHAYYGCDQSSSQYFGIYARVRRNAEPGLRAVSLDRAIVRENNRCPTLDHFSRGIHNSWVEVFYVDEGRGMLADLDVWKAQADDQLRAKLSRLKPQSNALLQISKHFFLDPVSRHKRESRTALTGGVSPNRRKFRQPNSSPATIASRSII